MAQAKVTNSMADKDYATATDKSIDIMLTKLGLGIVRNAMIRANAFVDTGRLRGSITWATMGEKSETESPASANDAVSRPNKKWVLHIGTNVEYAEYVEYGTERRPRTPYLRPAFLNHRNAVRKVGKAALTRILKNKKGKVREVTIF